LWLLYPDHLAVFDPSYARYLERLKAHAHARNLPYLDLLPLIRQHEGDVAALYHAPPRDFHFGRSGNQLVVRAIEQYLSSAGVLP
jgi:hypothetical protein